MLYSAFSIELLIGYFKNTPDRNEGGQMSTNTYATGARCKHTCAYDGGIGGQIFAILVCMY